ncbi:MAG: sporulation protein YunB [Clostridia bacterium]
MRLKYYKLTLRQMSLKKPFVFVLVVSFLSAVIVLFLNKNIIPIVKTLCISNAASIALLSTNKAIEENIQDIKYNNLVTIQKDKEERVTAISANVVEMSRLSNKISMDVQKRIEASKISKIAVPAGSFFGSNLFGSVGPLINVKTIPSGIVKVEFLSEFESAGINQTKHRIYLRIKTNVKIVAPFYIQPQEYANDVVIAETIIVGNAPTSYYNIEGIKEMTKKDTLNLIEGGK